MHDLEPVPETFLSRILQEFGLSWTHVAIISGVAFSAFGLDKYLDPAIWILGTVAAFIVVYTFRHQISGRFGRLAGGVFVCAGVAIGVPGGILAGISEDIGKSLANNRDFSSLYLSLVCGGALGILIMSYRKQDPEQRAPLPRGLAEAVETSVMRATFVNQSVVYILDLRPQDSGKVRFVYEVAMEIVNRSRKPAQYRDIFDPAGAQAAFHHATVDGVAVDVANPVRRTGRGLLLEQEVLAGKVFQVSVAGHADYYARDSELVGTYLAAERLSILVKKPPQGLSISFQSLLRDNVEAQTLPNGDRILDYSGGILPFQGVRVFWDYSPRSESSASAGRQSQG